MLYVYAFLHTYACSQMNAYAKNNGHIILRAKVINEKNILKIYQIWKNKKVREQWENKVDPKYFTNTVPLVTYQYPLSIKRKNKLFRSTEIFWCNS